MILSIPFNGSKWLQNDYVDAYNRRFNLIDLRSTVGSSEFFRWDNTEFASVDGVVKLNTREEKINFLEAERIKGNEYMYRCKFFDLYNYDDVDNQIYLNWFGDFYSDRYHTVKLQKRDVWIQFANTISGFYDHPATVSIQEIKNWICRLKVYENYSDRHDTWYTEDLTNKNTAAVFGVEPIRYELKNDNGNTVEVSFSEWHENLLATQSKFIEDMHDGNNIKEVFELYYNNWQSKYNTNLSY